MSARIVAIDTETTSLRADRRAWEIGIIARVPVVVKHPDGPDTYETEDREHHWFIDADHLDLGGADLMSLKIGRFFDRHPQHRLDREFSYSDVEDEGDTLREVEAITRGAHLVGAVVSFDAEVLGNRMREHGICPSWHYHLIDVEALAVGYLAAGSRHPAQSLTPPWKSDDLSRLLGVTVSEEDRHTALGDAKWAMRIYDAVMGNTP
jgi:DNA polymerase III epsilon subunit-like protein